MVIEEEVVARFAALIPRDEAQEASVRHQQCADWLRNFHSLLGNLVSVPQDDLLEMLSGHPGLLAELFAPALHAIPNIIAAHDLMEQLSASIVHRHISSLN